MFFGLGCVGRQAVAVKTGRPALDLNFMAPGTLDPRLTFTRASVGTYFDVTGTLQTATSGTPRWDYDPVTHVPRGLLLEDGRTNILLNSATLGTQSVAVAAQAYVLSFYGTGTITLTGASTAGPLTGTGAFPARVSLVFTPSGGTLTLTVTGSVLNAQLEASNYGYPTSWIPTTGASVARAAEACSMSTAGWLNSATSTLAIEYMVGQSPNPSAALVRDACCISDGSAANRLFLRAQGVSAAVATIGTTVASATTFSGAVGTTAANAVSKFASAWNGTTAVGSFNAGATVSYSVGMPAGLTTLAAGNDYPGAAAYLNGWVRRVRYWSRALSNAELQAATT
jgi:hypothetical protein